MVVEQRTYTFLPGQATRFLQVYEAEGMAVQLRHLERLVGYYVSEIGALNQTVTLWAYDDLGERERRRRALSEDPAWQVYLEKVRPMMLAQESQILAPATFFQAPLTRMIEANRRKS